MVVSFSRAASRTARANADVLSRGARSSSVLGTAVVGMPRTVARSPSRLELLKTSTPPWRRGPPLPGRVTIVGGPVQDDRPQTAAALSWLRQVRGAVSVAALHLPHSSCSRTGGSAKTPCSTITSRPTSTRCAIALALSPNSASCARDTRLNCAPATLAIPTSLTSGYRPQRGTFAPRGAERRGWDSNPRSRSTRDTGFKMDTGSSGSWVVEPFSSTSRTARCTVRCSRG